MQRHARSEKLLNEGRLKIMLNNNGEIENPENSTESPPRLPAFPPVNTQWYSDSLILKPVWFSLFIMDLVYTHESFKSWQEHRRRKNKSRQSYGSQAKRSNKVLSSELKSNLGWQWLLKRECATLLYNIVWLEALKMFWGEYQFVFLNIAPIKTPN